MEAKIFRATKDYFEKIEVSVNKAQIRNAVSNVCTFLLDEDLLIEIVLRALYPQSEFREVCDDD